MTRNFKKSEMFKEMVKNPELFVRAVNRLGLLKWISDEKYIRWRYKTTFNEELNLDHPTSFSEKLQWLKLYNRNPLYTKLVDKLEVRNYIKEKINEAILIPLIGSWNSIEEIEWDMLPNQFVLKSTHDSGGIIICKDKNDFNIKLAEKRLQGFLSRNYYYAGREWPYKNVQPKIIAEKLMVDESGYELKDYKFFCFNGEPKLLQVDFNRDEGHTKNLYDLDWNLLEVEYNVPNDSSKKIEKPQSFNKMIDYAKILSNNIPYVRVDFYSINGKIYFGELTFYPVSGFGKFNPPEYDELLGSWLKLPDETFD